MENKNYEKYIKYLILSLILTTIGAFIGGFLPRGFIMIYGISSLILLIVFMFSKGSFKRNVFYIFSIGEGVTLAPMLSHFTSVSLFGCLLITTFIVTTFTIVGLKTKNLSFLSEILFICLLSILLYCIVGIFIPLPSISLVIIVIFCLYVAYDINCFKRDSNANPNGLSDEEILDSVMNIYLDIINIFIHIVSIFGGSDD